MICALLGDAARDGINGILKGFGWASNPADVTGFANSEDRSRRIMQHMIDDPRMGTLIVASSGAEAQARQVISQRDGTDKGGGVPCGREAGDAKAGLEMLKSARIPVFYTPDKVGPWPAEPRLAYLIRWRERRLADGFAAASSRTAAQDEAIAFGAWFGRGPTLSGVRKQAAVGSLGRGERAGAPGGVCGRTLPRPPSSLDFRWLWKADLPDILHKTEAGVVRLNLERCGGGGADGLCGHPGQCKGLCSTGSNQRPVGAGDGGRRRRSYRWRVQRPPIGPGVLLFGSGGVMVEVYGDVALRAVSDHSRGGTSDDR